jgi:antirestriction protein ArdC
MSKRHYFFLLDHMVVALKPDFRDGVTETTLECGLEPHADDMEVINLASRRHAILVTVDVKIIKKCRDFQDRSSRGCLYGLLMLPDGILIQRRILEDIKTGVNPQWLTCHQARRLAGHVRQGEVGFPIVYWKFGKREVQNGDEIMEKRSVLCLYYTVFNVEQCEGLKIRSAEPAENQPHVPPIEACEQIVAGWRGKPVIKHGGDCASYSKVFDSIRMPERTRFDGAEEYYSTLFHELTHSTGHSSRLNRSSLADFERFGDHNYSREELVAEMGAAFLAGYCGIENRTINNSAAYLANWLDALKNDSRMVLIAASQAQRAVDLILGICSDVTT